MARPVASRLFMDVFGFIGHKVKKNRYLYAKYPTDTNEGFTLYLAMHCEMEMYF
jgi:hypothetical protein